MKKKIAVLAAAAFVLLGCSGCGNMVAKSYGGTVNIDLPVGEKLAEVTWKDNIGGYFKNTSISKNIKRN